MSAGISSRDCGCWFSEGLGHVFVSSRVHNDDDDERSDGSIPACMFAGDWQVVSSGERDSRSIFGFKVAYASDRSAVSW